MVLKFSVRMTNYQSFCVQSNRALVFVTHSIGSIVVKEVSGL
jgi:hypothetical protein